MVRLHSGSLLAFAEQRLAGCSDFGPHNLGLRRSTDDGRTWGRIVMVQPGHGRSIITGSPAEVRYSTTVYVTL